MQCLWILPAWLLLLLIDGTVSFSIPTSNAVVSQRRVGKQAAVRSRTLMGRRMVDVTHSDTKNMSNPSTAFGRPLSDEVKDFDKFMVSLIKNVVFDTLFSGSTPERGYARFYALETIARMPYFAYTSVLHFLETFGKWRQSEYLKIHFAEDWNELHHLLIMEELGGNANFFDRFVAQHIAFVYYFLAFGAYLYNPTLAYNINQSVEEHAYATYHQFLTDHEHYLKTQPPPKVAIDYYVQGDLYMFDEMQTGKCEPRRPQLETLYDVFVAIRDDEAQHAETMAKLQTSVQLTTPHSWHSMEECQIQFCEQTQKVIGKPTTIPIAQPPPSNLRKQPFFVTTSPTDVSITRTSQKGRDQQKNVPTIKKETSNTTVGRDKQPSQNVPVSTP